MRVPIRKCWMITTLPLIFMKFRNLSKIMENDPHQTCEGSARGNWDPREAQQPFRPNLNGVGYRTTTFLWRLSVFVRPLIQALWSCPASEATLSSAMPHPSERIWNNNKTILKMWSKTKNLAQRSQKVVPDYIIWLMIFTLIFKNHKI